MVETAWRTVSNIFNKDQFNWSVSLGVIALMVLYYSFDKNILMKEKLSEWLGAIPSRRGRAMRRARRDFIRSDTIDALVDHVEKRVFAGDYTRKEANEIYREARKAWQCKDLFPNPQLLKENIQKRLAAKQNDPVPLPEKTEKVEKKTMFSGKPTKLAKA